MKRIFRRLTAAVSAAAMMVSACSGLTNGIVGYPTVMIAEAAVKTKCEIYEGTNINEQTYTNWTNPIDSYLVPMTDGGYMRLQNGADEEHYLVEYYDADFNIENTILIDVELPVFGGFYAHGDCYYLLTGQTNTEESAETECYRITKYDASWNRIGSVGLYDCNTTVPFDAGSARFSVSGDYLFIRTSHEMYTSSNDGLNHQANVTIAVDMENMTITDSFTKVANSEYGFISHSFNQFIHVEDGHLVALDHGDANPRSIVLTQYNTDASSGTFVPDYDTPCTTTNIVRFPGSSGNNYTGASVGGFEISSSSYLAAYAAENYEDDTLDNTTRNIYVGVVNKDTNEVTNIQITEYADGSPSASTPHLVKMSDQLFALLWSWNGAVYYTLLDDEGNPGEISKFEGAQLSDCVPIVVGKKLVWYTWSNHVNTFYTVDVASGTQSAVVIENGHDTEVLSEPAQAGGECIVYCTQCKEEFTFKTPDSVTFWWRLKGAFLSSTALPVTQIGDTVEYEIRFNGEYDKTFNEYDLTISDTEHTVMENMGNEGRITFNKEGKYTLTFTHKYNPALSKSFTLKINHYKDHPLVKTPAEEGADHGIMECQDCDYTEKFTVPTVFNVYWEKEGGSLYTTLQSSYCITTDFEIYVQVDGSCDDKSMTVEIDDPTIAVYEENVDEYGTDVITCLSEGETTIRVYPTYNPSLVKTYTLVVAHAYEEGKCRRCGHVCEHEKGNVVDASCVDLAVCAECKMQYGDVDLTTHISDEVYYVINEASPDTHDVFYNCCDTFYVNEPHEFLLSEDSEYYTCICNAVAAASVEADGEITYYSDFEKAVIDASCHSGAKLTVLNSLQLRPLSIENGDFTIDINGKLVEFSGAGEDGYALTFKDASIVFEDSAGNGGIIAYDGAGLFDLDRSVLTIKGGGFSAKGTFANLKDGSVDLYGGNLHADQGIVASKSNVSFYGTPVISCSVADIVLQDDSWIYLYEELGNTKYLVSVDAIGEYAFPITKIEVDPLWFEIVEENRVTVLEKDGSLSCKYDFTAAQVTLEPSEAPYNGTENPPTVSVLFEDGEADYSIVYTNADGKDIGIPKEAGEYFVKLTGKGDFAGVIELPYHITTATPKLTWKSETETLVYNDSPAEITPVQIDLQGDDEFSGIVSYFYRKSGTDDGYLPGLPRDAGDYEIKASIAAFENYTSAETQTSLLLTIQKAPVPEYDIIKLNVPFTDKSCRVVKMPDFPMPYYELTSHEIVLNDPYGLINTEMPITLANNHFSFCTVKNDHTVFGKTAQFILTITSDNYEDVVVTVEVTMDKGILTYRELKFTDNIVVYNGKPQAPVVSLLPGVEGAGEVILSYTDVYDKKAEPVNAGEYYVTVEVEEGKYYRASEKFESQDDWVLIIKKAPITEISMNIAAPVIGEKPQTSAEDGEFWTLNAIFWNTVEETFGYNTNYQVEIVVEADDNHYFTEDIAVEGFTIFDCSESSLGFKKQFDATPKEKITSFPVPADRVMAIHCQSAKEVLDCLPTSTKVKTESGYRTLPIDWKFSGGYDPTPNAVHLFTWTVDVGDLDAGKYVTSKTIKVKNADYTDVSDTIHMSVSDLVYGQTPEPSAEGFKLVYTYSIDGENFTKISEFYDKNKYLPAGKYYVRGSYQSDTERGAVTKTFTVSPLEIIITPDQDQSKSYGDEEPELRYSHTALLRKDAITGSLLREEGETVGEYTYSIAQLKASDSYKLLLDPDADVFSIERAVPKLSDPTASSLIFGQKLKNSELSDGWTWVDASVIPTVDNEGFAAVYVISDAVNYDYSQVEGYDAKTKKVTRIVPVLTEKADPIVTPLLVGTGFIEGDVIPEITTSDGDTAGSIFWVNTDVTLSAGENLLEWHFSPVDDVNYNGVNGILLIEAETTTTTTTTSTTTTTTTTVTETTTTSAATTTKASTTTSATTTTKASTTTSATTTTKATTTTTKATTTTTKDTTTTTKATTTTTKATTTTTKDTTTTTKATTTTTKATTTTTKATTTTTKATTTTTKATTTTTKATTTTIKATTTTTKATTTTTKATTTTTKATTTTTKATTTTTKMTTTTTKATTTTTKATTTTTKATTTTTKVTTTTTSETTTEFTTTTTLVSYTYVVETKPVTFHYSDDDAELQAENLIAKIMRHAVYSDGTVSEEGVLLDDFGCVSFDALTPKKLYTQDGVLYNVTAIIHDEFGDTLIENTVKLYIGVRGDANLDGTADAKDAAEILVYAAAIGAGQEGKLYTSDNESLEQLAFYLADVNGTTNADATDAASILQFAAAVGSGKPIDWEEILGAA